MIEHRYIADIVAGIARDGLTVGVHDHVIVGNGTDAYVSLASRGDL